MKITWLADTELRVVNLDTDIEAYVKFGKGEESEVDIVAKENDKVTLQFPDKIAAFLVGRDYFAKSYSPPKDNPSSI